MATDAPSNLPPVLRPDASAGPHARGLAARFARETRGDLGGATLTGITLATADLRPGDVFVAVRGREPPWRGVRRRRRREGRGRGRDGCRGRRSRRGHRASGHRRRRPARAARRSVRVGVRHRARTTSCRSCSARPEPTARRACRTCSRGSSASSASSPACRRRPSGTSPGEVIVSRLTTPEAYEMHALLALMRERGVEAVAVEVSAQALSRRRVDGLVFDVAGVHQPLPRPPRRLRRHARVLRGEAARCSAPTARAAP